MATASRIALRFTVVTSRLDYNRRNQMATSKERAKGGVTKLTVIHDLTNAPMLASLVAGELESNGAGGGWNENLSGLKTLLETGAQLPFQSGR
jgi:hypothetical protein